MKWGFDSLTANYGEAHCFANFIISKQKEL